MEFFPVVLRCGDVSVAVPIKILMQESSVFSAMFSSDGNREQLEKSTDKQPADGRNEMKCRSNESRLQVDLIDIEGYSGKAVKILIEYLLGYNYLLLTLKDLKVLADMLKICCSYDFKTCIIKVEETLNGVPISEDNLMDALNLLEVIQEIDEYQHTYEDTYDELYAKCLIVGQKSFSSKQKLIDFLVKNKSQTDKIFKLLSDNYFNQRESIRFTIRPDKIEDNPVLKSPTHLINNIPFHIKIDVSEQEPKMLGFYLVCENSEEIFDESISLKFTVPANCILFRYSSVTKVLSANFKKQQEIGFKEFISLDMAKKINWNISFEIDADFGSKCSPYIRKNIFGLSTIPKLNNAPDKCEIENAKENPYKSGDPVIIQCEDLMIAISQSLLVEESNVFKSMFSQLWRPEIENQPNETNNDKVNNSTRPGKQVEIVQVTGFDPRVVKFLFDYLQGYTCCFPSDVYMLGKILMLCDYYELNKPVKKIFQAIISIEITLDNVLEFFETAKMLELVESFENIAANLTRRCIQFATANLLSASHIVEFIIKNQDNLESVVEFLEFYNDDNVVYIYAKVENISKIDKHIRFPEFIFKEKSWNVDITKNDLSEPYLGCLLNLYTSFPSIRFHMDISIYNWTSGEFITLNSRSISLSFARSTGVRDLIKWNDLLDEDNGYIQDDTVLVEVILEYNGPNY